MSRRNFYDIINNSEINIRAEYDRIYEIYHSDEYVSPSIAELVYDSFRNFPESIKKRTVSLDDFNNTFNFHFSKYSSDITVDGLISFCEYITNLTRQLNNYCEYILDVDDTDNINLLHTTIAGCIDELGLMPAKREDIIIYVEKRPEAISVAEIVPPEMAFSVLEYNHYRLKGDLTKKKNILKNMADNIEDERRSLRNINTGLESQLYQLMNKFIRHDHSQTPYILGMSEEEIEKVYDDIYQLWLLAKLEIDNVERRKQMKQLLDEINQ